MRLFFAFSLAMITSFSLASERNRENVQHASMEEDRSLSQIVSAISAKSIEDWASLWKRDCHPIQIKDLDLTIEENLALLDLWLFSFHYWNYSKQINNNPICIQILSDAKEKIFSSTQSEYTKKYIEFLINGINK